MSEQAGAADLLPAWDVRFGEPRFNNQVLAVDVSDTGMVAVGGSFSASGSDENGELNANRVAIWDGVQWARLGDGFNNGPDHTVNALLWVGEELYVGGEFSQIEDMSVNSIARWDGSAWHAFESGGGNGVLGSVRALVEVGGEVVVAGNFDQTSFGPANNIARWTGVRWLPMASGIEGDASTHVNALAVGTDGSIYVGGHFEAAGGVSSFNVAKWNGTGWEALGDGLGDRFGTVHALAISSDNQLVAGGEFSVDGENTIRNLAVWNGVEWTDVGGGVEGTVLSLAFKETDLWVGGGLLTTSGGEHSGVARLREGLWDTPAGGLSTGGSVPPTIKSMAAGSDTLYLVGDFETSDSRVGFRGMAEWDGSEFQTLYRGFPDRDDYPEKISVAGGNVVLAGAFDSVGGELAMNVVRLEDDNWKLLGSHDVNGVTGDGEIRAVAAGASGSVYVGGSFTEIAGVSARNLAMWDGTDWSALGTGVAGGSNRGIRSLALTSEGDLYAGGTFTSIDGVDANHVAKWDGSAWTPLADGLAWSSDPNRTIVLSLHWDGDRLYAGGRFDRSGSLDASSMAWWDGESWKTFDSGISYPGFNPSVHSIATAGFEVFLGGSFSMAGGSPAANIARWSAGSGWEGLGSGLNSGVDALLFYSGTLYAAGNFLTAGGESIEGLAQWNESGWSDVVGGLKGSHPFGTDLGAGEGRLYVVGRFVRAGSALSPHLGVLHLGNAPPESVWVSPVPGEQVPAGTDVTLRLEPNDTDGSIASVSFFDEGRDSPIATLSMAPWEHVLENPSVGRHRLAALVTDDDGAKSWSLVRRFDVLPDGDNINPVVMIASPEEGEVFKASPDKIIVADAFDEDGTVVRVEFYEGNASLGIVESPPWSLVWPDLVAGEYQLTARATDDDGGMEVSDSVNVSVLPPNSPPFVSIGSFNDGEVFEDPGTLTLRARCTDGDGGVTNVQFLIGDTSVHEFEEESPTGDYVYDWSPAAFGDHHFRVIATDTDGAQSELTRMFSIVPFNEPPTIELFGPENESTIVMPDSVAFPVEVDDVDGEVVQVDWMSFDRLLVSKTSPPWVFNLRNVAPSTYGIWARAVDNLGKFSGTPVREITVTNNPTAQPMYRLIELTIPGGGLGAAFDINNNSVVVGTFENEEGDSRGYYWTLGAFVDIGDQVSPRESASLLCLGLNESRHIVGSGHLSGGQRAFQWDGTSIVNLGVLGQETASGSFSRARAINESGWIVGGSMNSNRVDRAFLYRDGSMLDLGGLEDDLDASEAFDINDQGQVVGWVDALGERRAFIYDDVQGMRELGPFAVGPARAHGINNLGQVVGQYENAVGDQNAFVWTGGLVVDLGTLGGPDSMANDINERAQIVGRSEDFEFNERAFLWQNCTMFDLNASITNVNWKLVEAHAINDAGWIVGVGTKDFGTQDQAFLLVPESDHAPVLPPIPFGAANLVDGRFQFCLPAPKSMTYRVDESADLKVWSSVSTNYVSEGVLDFYDERAANDPTKFYRAVVLPEF